MLFYIFLCSHEIHVKPPRKSLREERGHGGEDIGVCGRRGAFVRRDDRQRQRAEEQLRQPGLRQPQRVGLAPGAGHELEPRRNVRFEQFARAWDFVRGGS